MKKEIRRLILANPEDVINSPLAAEIMLGDNLSADLTFQLKVHFPLCYFADVQQLLFWSPVVPPTAITYFLQSFGNNPLILQYAMRSLLHHPIPVTFFYVPQVVQALRYDELGYVEQFIMEASLLSPLFAHQIIWNMNANAYKDEDSTIPDPLKPVLDRLTRRMTDALSGEDKDFYEREFSFFNEVTSISGKLKPFIKRPKPEKKAKIDEEMKKIKLDVGVYLPSNPDGELIGIDRKSGRPLQSHAKAPFMATFRIRRVRKLSNGNGQDMEDGDDEGETVTEVMQSAIFKVGDDCRQDVLALQLISAFRSIFNSVGLDLYLFPYRVTATAPGVSNLANEANCSAGLLMSCPTQSREIC
jgi:phosphatidylinositol 4-kinase